MSKRMRGFAMMALVLLLALPALAMGAAQTQMLLLQAKGEGCRRP